jgi:hypothetical protein
MIIIDDYDDMSVPINLFVKLTAQRSITELSISTEGKIKQNTVKKCKNKQCCC